jgi:regulation of enolase protein 1 (concanavalin A-like superfamily)
MKKIITSFILLFSFSALWAQSDKLNLSTIPHALQWEIKPLSHSLKQDELVMVAGEKTDMFRDPNVTYNTDNAPKLLFKPDENFVLSAAIEH